MIIEFDYFPPAQKILQITQIDFGVRLVFSTSSLVEKGTKVDIAIRSNTSSQSYRKKLQGTVVYFSPHLPRLQRGCIHVHVPEIEGVICVSFGTTKQITTIYPRQKYSNPEEIPTTKDSSILQVGNGYCGISSVLCKSLPEDMNISENSLAYWISNVVGCSTLIIKKDTYEGKILEQKINSCENSSSIRNFILKTWLSHISVEQLEITINLLKTESHSKGKREKLEEVKKVLDIN